MIVEDKEYLKRGTYEIDRVLIDRNGNVIDYVYENDKITIKRPNDIQSEERKKYLEMKNDRDELENIITNECGSFYFNFFNGGLLEMDIKESIKLRFLYLCTYTNYKEKGMYLVYDNGKRMDRGGIEDVLGLSEAEFKRTMSTLLKSGLLIKENTHYVVNGDIIHRGSLSKSKSKQGHSRIFDNGLRELYNNCDPKQHKQLYYLFKLLPYVNVKYNVICQNPSEDYVEDVIPLKLSEICEVVGYNPKNSGRFEKEILQLQLFGEYAMLGIKCGSGMWYKMNPRLLYAGTGNHIDEFKKLLCTDFKVSCL